MILMSMYTCIIPEKGTLVRDEGRVEAESLSVPRVWQPAEGQPMNADSARREAQIRAPAASGQGEEAVQKSHKVKRKGLLARAEQLRRGERK